MTTLLTSREAGLSTYGNLLAKLQIDRTMHTQKRRKLRSPLRADRAVSIVQRIRVDLHNSARLMELEETRELISSGER